MTTTNLSDFGTCELGILARILEKYANGDYVHPYFSDKGVQAMMNTMSGFVFLIDDDCNVLMLNGDTLEGHYSLPYSGEEGFLDDFSEDEDDYNREDWEYLQNIREAISQ
jgi:hypothetical protein